MEAKRTKTELSGKTAVVCTNNDGTVSNGWMYWEIIDDGKRLKVSGEIDGKIVREEIHTAKDGWTFDPNKVECFGSCYDWNEEHPNPDGEKKANKKEILVATMDVPLDSKYKDDYVFITIRVQDMKILNINMGFVRDAWDMPCNLDPNCE